MTGRWLYAGKSCKRKQRNTQGPIRTGWELSRLPLHCRTRRALAGMLAKHIVSLYDMCFADGMSFDAGTWDEKITDSLNYLFLLKAIVKEGQTNQQN